MASRRLPSIRNIASRISGEIANQSEARRFAREIGEGDEITFTYDPTATTWPSNGWSHPRTSRAGYDRNTSTLRVQFFSNGAVYDYHDVPPAVAQAFRRTNSPGKFINSTLNRFSYERVN